MTDGSAAESVDRPRPTAEGAGVALSGEASASVGVWRVGAVGSSVVPIADGGSDASGSIASESSCSSSRI